MTEQVITQTPEQKPVNKKEQQKKNLKYQRDKDREPVKGIFKFYEVPGGKLEFPFRAYKEDPVEFYSLVDGQVHTIPLGVARHLNKNGKYPVHGYALDDEGKPSVKIGKWVRRFGFQSLEFVDIDDLTENGSALITVEYPG